MKVNVRFGDAPPPAPSAPRAWSTQQQAIFTWFASGRGNLVVRARAGTGKTTTILEGVERAPERQILLAAFNKSIARELQARVRNPRVEAKTLHGLGLKYVRRNWRVEVEEDDQKGERARKLARRACGEQAPDPIVKVVANLHTKAREIAPHACELADVEARARRSSRSPPASTCCPTASGSRTAGTSPASARRRSSRCATRWSAPTSSTSPT